jgi:predicted dehydrogenase
MGLRHVEVVQQLGMDVVGVADGRPDALKAAQDQRAIPADRCYSDGIEAIAKSSPKCVVVATTAPSHAALVLEAAERGAKWILCEKPLAVSLAECDEMMEACRKSGTLLAVNHQMRFMEQYTIPKALLDSDALGGFQSATVVTGNFGLAMNGTHYFEMFRYMAGEPAAEVSAWFSKETVANPRGAEFVDRAGAIRAATKSGKRFFLDASADQGHGMTAMYSGRYGQIVIDELAGTMRVTARNAEHRSLPTTRYGMPFSEETTKIKPADSLSPTKSVLEALLSGENYPAGEEGRAAVATLVAAYISNDAGGSTVQVERANDRREEKFPWA